MEKGHAVDLTELFTELSSELNVINAKKYLS